LYPYRKERISLLRRRYYVTFHKLSKSHPIIARKDAFAEVVTRRFYIRLLRDIPRDICRRRKRIVPRRSAR